MSHTSPANARELRTRVANLRRELFRATQAYRSAVAQHDSEQAIPLLRSRSQLMRDLLEAQCELLLTFRAIASEEGADSRATPAEARPSVTVDPISGIQHGWQTSALLS